MLISLAAAGVVCRHSSSLMLSAEGGGCVVPAQVVRACAHLQPGRGGMEDTAASIFILLCDSNSTSSIIMYKKIKAVM